MLTDQLCNKARLVLFSIAVGVVSAIMAMSSVVCLVFHNTTSIALLFWRGRRWFVLLATSLYSECYDLSSTVSVSHAGA